MAAIRALWALVGRRPRLALAAGVLVLVAAAALSAFLLTRPERYNDEFLHTCSCMEIVHVVKGALGALTDSLPLPRTTAS